MSYTLRGFGGLGCMSSYQLAAACGDTGSGGCDPRDTDCVARAQFITDWSQEVLNSFFPCIPDDLQIQCPSIPNSTTLDQQFLNNTPIDPGSGYTSPASGGSMSTPVVSFSPSRAGGILYPGDTWTVNIRGGAPNAQVNATMGGSTTPMGKTDANGNFAISGTVTAGQVGVWNETWTVGGVNAGSFSFTVSQNVVNSNGPSNAPGGSNGGSQAPATGQWFTGVSNEVVIAVGVGALALFLMGKK